MIVVVCRKLSKGVPKVHEKALLKSSGRKNILHEQGQRPLADYFLLVERKQVYGSYLLLSRGKVQAIYQSCFSLIYHGE